MACTTRRQELVAGGSRSARMRQLSTPSAGKSGKGPLSAMTMKRISPLMGATSEAGMNPPPPSTRLPAGQVATARWVDTSWTAVLVVTIS
jgi:hypothetical protein